MAKEEAFQFLSADGKTQIHAKRWIPDSGEYKGILQIAHGMIEYMERYTAFAQYLTNEGYMVVAHDHLGHGDSVTSTDDWGYFAQEHPSDILVADMHKLRTMTQDANPKKVYFILGHSMGSYILRKYIAIHGEGIDGAIIMGTGYIPDATTKLGMTIAKVIATFRGWHYRSKFVQSLSYDKPYKQYDVTGKNTNNSWLTKDEDTVKKYYSDPKCTYVFTLNGYMGLFETVLFDNQQENIEKVPKELPILLVSGAKDPVGNMGDGVKKVYAKFENAGIKDITWKIYENDRHEILNETDREDVYHDIDAWMNVHMEQ